MSKVAQCTHTPIGYLHLIKPLDDVLPVQDFRTKGGAPRKPSPELLETIYAMQNRQSWMREERIREGISPLSIVGAYDSSDTPVIVAKSVRSLLSLDDGWASRATGWESALRLLRDRVEDAGILVVFSGVVGNNPKRPLRPDEFQGFALVDEYAPLVFVNNKDYKAAQMFTLMHEVAHIFVGQTGVSVFDSMLPSSGSIEKFCNSVAAEFLVPKHRLLEIWPEIKLKDPYNTLARKFKVSPLVAARRALDTGLIDNAEFFDFYQSTIPSHEPDNFKKEGGDFWRTQKWRLGYKFANAVYNAVQDGRLTYTEAYSLTDLHGDTFEKIQKNMRL